MPIGTLADLGALPGMPSLPSLQRFIASRPDFPLVERGDRGRAYALDLDVAAAFVREHWRDGRRVELGDPRLAQLNLPMMENDDG